VKKAAFWHVKTAMEYPQTQSTSPDRYLDSERPIELDPASSISETPSMLAALSDAALASNSDQPQLGAAESPAGAPAASATFAHDTKTLGVLGLFLSIAIIVSWQLARLPLGTSGSGLAGLALIATGFLAFRLWLGTQSVTIDETGFDLRTGNRTQRIPFNTIRKIRFDRVSHDLLVETTQHTHRLARTLQGHRVIRQRLLAAIPQQQQATDDSSTLFVKPRLLPRVAGTLALCVMAMCVSAIMWVDPGLGVLNLLGLLLPTYVLFDRCIRRTYRLNHDGIKIRGLFRSRFHARGELMGAVIRKGALSSTLRLTFSNETVELDEYLLGQSLVEVSEFIENSWAVRVRPPGHASGVHPGVTSELT